MSSFQRGKHDAQDQNRLKYSDITLCFAEPYCLRTRRDAAVAPLAQPQTDANASVNANTNADTSANANANANANYDLDPIVVNYQQYKIGDTLPEQYLDKSYTIVEWQKRHLPAPQVNTHWAYINANYILITNDSAQIVQAKSGDIYFRG